MTWLAGAGRLWSFGAAVYYYADGQVERAIYWLVLLVGLAVLGSLEQILGSLKAQEQAARDLWRSR